MLPRDPHGSPSPSRPRWGGFPSLLECGSPEGSAFLKRTAFVSLVQCSVPVLSLVLAQNWCLSNALNDCSAYRFSFLSLKKKNKVRITEQIKTKKFFLVGYFFFFCICKMLTLAFLFVQLLSIKCHIFQHVIISKPVSYIYIFNLPGGRGGGR